jgi:hypothetical protein
MDAHPKVQEAGRQALIEIGKVIRNDEIAVLVPVLLSALMDPAEKTQQALDALANTPFVHSIDPPSLGLIVPILRCD